MMGGKKKGALKGKGSTRGAESRWAVTETGRDDRNRGEEDAAKTKKRQSMNDAIHGGKIG